MNTNDFDRMKSLLGVMVRRHSRHGTSHPVGALIAREANRVDASGSDGATNDQLVDRLYRRLLSPRHSTVAISDSPSVTREVHS